MIENTLTAQIRFRRLFLRSFDETQHADEAIDDSPFQPVTAS